MKKCIISLTVWILMTTICVANSEEIENFENAEIGVLPSNVKSYKGEWVVIKSKDGTGQSKVFAQTAANSGMTFNVVLWDKDTYQTVDVSVKIKAVAGQEDQGGGLIWRAKDENNYYIARYNPLEGNYRVYKVVEGKRSQLQSADVKATPTWHHLWIIMKEGHIEGYFDETKYLDVTDNTFTDAGKIGLWTKADAQTYFDDLTVKEIQ